MERLVDRMLDRGDKLRMFEILDTYSHEEIAIAYAYWAMGAEGIGFIREKKKAKGR